ncbi:MAG: hypothetical protein ACPHN2_18055 [Sinimarinibacterium flocculans]|uniref:hypothetical protein n=1 Tax=Sinimarinibacterium flocculans TaxID=985250 RepID=UPI002EA53890|nr:hypothetical protein [Pseudomonadota bacterium]
METTDRNGSRGQRVGALLWSGFLGAASSVGVLLTLPPHWFEQGAGFGELSQLFFVCWALAMVPALSAWMLARSPRRRAP